MLTFLVVTMVFLLLLGLFCSSVADDDRRLLEEAEVRTEKRKRLLKTLDGLPVDEKKEMIPLLLKAGITPDEIYNKIPVSELPACMEELTNAGLIL